MDRALYREGKSVTFSLQTNDYFLPVGVDWVILLFNMNDYDKINLNDLSWRFNHVKFYVAFDLSSTNFPLNIFTQA